MIERAAYFYADRFFTLFRLSPSAEDLDHEAPLVATDKIATLDLIGCPWEPLHVAGLANSCRDTVTLLTLVLPSKSGVVNASLY